MILPPGKQLAGPYHCNGLYSVMLLPAVPQNIRFMQAKTGLHLITQYIQNRNFQFREKDTVDFLVQVAGCWIIII